MSSLASTAIAAPAPRALPVSSPARPQRHPIPALGVVAAIDVVTVRMALLFAGLAPQSLIFTAPDVMVLMAMAAATLAIFRMVDLYSAKSVRQWRGEASRVVAAVSALAGVVVVLQKAGIGVIQQESIGQFWIVATGLTLLARTARARLARARCRRVVIVGSGARALRLCRDMAADPLMPYQVLGFVDTARPASPFVARRTLGHLEDLERILAGEHVDEVHVALPVRSQYAAIQDTIRVCERVGVKLMYRADIFDLSLARPHLVAPSSQVELRVVTEDGAGIAIKRAIDIVGSLCGLIALGPLMLAVAAGITLQDGGPVLFAQERYGLNRRKFRMLKFRSMVLNADKLQASLEAMNEAKGPVFKIARDPRITRLGRIIRRTSIDELPQLINVLRGDMSLIGPRPLPLRDVARFTRPADMRRFSVRPGITGLWQVSGRSTLDFDRWITLDLHYIDNWSLALDFTILARTLPAVVRGTGAS
jgi:exopolysaccharide biosynthesis polyprenyl glycosylphosphotransferase